MKEGGRTSSPGRETTETAIDRDAGAELEGLIDGKVVRGEENGILCWEQGNGTRIGRGECLERILRTSIAVQITVGL